MRLTSLFPQLFGFGDRAAALWAGHPYALARTALRYELARGAKYLPDIIDQVLDVGCGSMPYRSLFVGASAYHGLEIDQPRNRRNPNVTHFYNGDLFPMAGSAYQLVICSQVLEHAFNPEQLLAESLRVLQPGGYLLLTIPFFWPEHEQPHDSQRFTSYGLRYRLEVIGFELVSLHKTNPGLATLLQLTIEWLESNIRQSLGHISSNKLRAALFLLWHLLMSLPYALLNLTGALYRSLPAVQQHPERAELFLDLVVIARKL